VPRIIYIQSTIGGLILLQKGISRNESAWESTDTVHLVQCIVDFPSGILLSLLGVSKKIKIGAA